MRRVEFEIGIPRPCCCKRIGQARSPGTKTLYVPTTHDERRSQFFAGRARATPLRVGSSRLQCWSDPTGWVVCLRKCNASTKPRQYGRPPVDYCQPYGRFRKDWNSPLGSGILSTYAWALAWSTGKVGACLPIPNLRNRVVALVEGQRAMRRRLLCFQALLSSYWKFPIYDRASLAAKGVAGWRELRAGCAPSTRKLRDARRQSPDGSGR